ncbi:hypothetical protein K438DRAFT_1756780 [Mycena galopus ATCC 62051]|nr:hypothetical protein K438DRAFT_1756780 [Mycena galopus ATCC 62051]
MLWSLTTRTWVIELPGESDLGGRVIKISADPNKIFGPLITELYRPMQVMEPGRSGWGDAEERACEGATLKEMSKASSKWIMTQVAKKGGVTHPGVGHGHGESNPSGLSIFTATKVNEMSAMFGDASQGFERKSQPITEKCNIDRLPALYVNRKIPLRQQELKNINVRECVVLPASLKICEP